MYSMNIIDHMSMYMEVVHLMTNMSNYLLYHLINSCLHKVMNCIDLIQLLLNLLSFVLNHFVLNLLSFVLILALMHQIHQLYLGLQVNSLMYTSYNCMNIKYINIHMEQCNYLIALNLMSLQWLIDNLNTILMMYSIVIS